MVQSNYIPKYCVVHRRHEAFNNRMNNRRIDERGRINEWNIKRD